MTRRRPTEDAEMRRARRGLSAVVCVIVAMGMLLTAPAAFAHESHAFSKTFGAKTSTPEDPYPLSNPTDVAVDNSSGDVYVSDPTNHRVEKFTASGQFLFMLGHGVNKTAVAEARSEAEKDLCPAPGHPTDQCQPGANNPNPGGFEGKFTIVQGNGAQSAEHLFLAVDNSPGGEGDLYVGDLPDSRITKFTPSGQIVTSWAERGQLLAIPSFRMKGIAVGQSGTLYVLSADPEGPYFPLYEYNQNAGLLTSFEWQYTNHPAGPGPQQEEAGIAVDTAGNTYYFGQFGVAKSNSSGEFVGSAEPGGLFFYGSVDSISGADLTVDPGTDGLYVSQGNAGFIRAYAAAPDLQPLSHLHPCRLFRRRPPQRRPRHRRRRRIQAGLRRQLDRRHRLPLPQDHDSRIADRRSDRRQTHLRPAQRRSQPLGFRP